MGIARAGPAGAAATAGVVVALDQATKQLVVSNIERGEHVSVFPGLEVTNARNTGVAFGALEGGGLIVAILIGVSLALLVGYFVVHRDMPWLWLPVGLLLGGALGNLADRAREGAVIDFIDPAAWPAFNLADACIVIGVLALLYVVEGRQRLARREAR
jgi:signal peptidase II